MNSISSTLIRARLGGMHLLPQPWGVATVGSLGYRPAGMADSAPSSVRKILSQKDKVESDRGRLSFLTSDLHIYCSCVCVCMHRHTLRWVVISRLVQDVLILWLYIHQGWREQAGVYCDRYSTNCVNFCHLLSKNIVHAQVIWDKCNYPGEKRNSEGKRETQRATDLLTFTYRWFSLPTPVSTRPCSIMLLWCSSQYNAKHTPAGFG